MIEAVLGPLFVFFAYNEIPSKWTLIGGSLLLCVLTIHESQPLFEKSRDVYRSMSSRFTGSVHDVITQELETSFDVGKSNAEVSFGEDDSYKYNF